MTREPETWLKNIQRAFESCESGCCNTSPNGRKMTDTLRTRLLHVLIDSTPPQYLPPPNDLSRILDAVIAELGLETQVHYDPDCEFYRYVTDWIDPQTSQKVDLP